MNYLIVLIAMVMLSGCTFLAREYLPAPGDATRGAQIFAVGHNDSPPCVTCHLTVAGQAGYSIGPNLAGIAERAAARDQGTMVEVYLLQSIIEPERSIVPGYRNMMYAGYAGHFSPHDMLDLIAYLLTL
ncbi:MAG: c-type cytochrome [Chloroflexota bacterium]|nr:c-type cytochrome [Chloroflexota bacterium]